MKRYRVSYKDGVIEDNEHSEYYGADVSAPMYQAAEVDATIASLTAQLAAAEMEAARVPFLEKRLRYARTFIDKARDEKPSKAACMEEISAISVALTSSRGTG